MVRGPQSSQSVPKGQVCARGLESPSPPSLHVPSRTMIGGSLLRAADVSELQVFEQSDGGRRGGDGCEGGGGEGGGGEGGVGEGGGGGGAGGVEGGGGRAGSIKEQHLQVARQTV